jgi:hypothetical protein
MLNELLLITREIEKVLEGENQDSLADLLDRRREISGRLDLSAVAPEAAPLLREIRAGEERCLVMAAARKQELQAGLAAVRTMRRVEKAYGTHC